MTMSLFPAYAQNLVDKNDDVKVSDGLAVATYVTEICCVSPTQEAQLLASDSDEEHQHALTVRDTRRESAAVNNSDFYIDRKFDCGNLRVSTLYYPGRPQYEAQKRVAVERSRRKRRRYFETALDAAPPHDELAERTRAYRHMLAEQPTDQILWLKFIHFQERYRDCEAALAVAEEAATRLGSCGALVRGHLHRLRAAVLPAPRRLDLLRAELAAAAPALAAELWLRLLADVAEHGAAHLDTCVAAALSATRADPAAYPHILYIYGGYLRAAGLWERLVLLLELVTSMNFGPDAFPPPPPDAAFLARVERTLQETEDKAIGSGLPLSTVWARVERARAAAHWRPAPAAGGEVGPDPQRVPLPSDVSELLLPAQGPEAQLALIVNALRLAKVPLLPCAGYVARAADASGDVSGDGRWAACGETLLALLRAARRLPAAHGSRASSPAVARRLVAHFVDPPHYFSDESGYLGWVSALWEASCGWARGAARTALVCWRLRWLHALCLLLEPGCAADAAEARRLRGAGRAVLKRWAGAEVLPYAQFARLELAAAGRAAGRRAALAAMRAALQDAAAPPAWRLYVARVVCEVTSAAPADAAGAWATACAALGSPLPPDDRLERAPPTDLLRDALSQCEATCADIEGGLEADPGAGEGLVSALLPGAGEWAAARARLAPAPRRAALLLRLHAAATSRAPAGGGQAARYWEQGACALALAAAREHATVRCARALQPLFPHNALLALAFGDGPLWSLGEAARGAALPHATHVGALAGALPALLRAAGADWAAGEAARAAAACGRAARGAAGGALLATARLEAEARAARGRPEAALLAALERHPQHKWVYVRGAAWCAAEAAPLADVLLERQLRTHALRDELELPPPARAQRNDLNDATLQ